MATASISTDSVFWQRCHLDGASGRGILWKEFGVYVVHFGKISHVFQEYDGFNHRLQSGSSRCQNVSDIGQCLTSFCFDSAWDKVAGNRFQAKLTGSEDQVTGPGWQRNRGR